MDRKSRDLENGKKKVRPHERHAVTIRGFRCDRTTQRRGDDQRLFYQPSGQLPSLSMLFLFSTRSASMIVFFSRLFASPTLCDPTALATPRSSSHAACALPQNVADASRSPMASPLTLSAQLSTNNATNETTARGVQTEETSQGCRAEGAVPGSGAGRGWRRCADIVSGVRRGRSGLRPR